VLDFLLSMIRGVNLKKIEIDMCLNEIDQKKEIEMEEKVIERTETVEIPEIPGTEMAETEMGGTEKAETIETEIERGEDGVTEVL